METKYHTLRRPRRKLCYLTTKKSPSKQWAGNVSLGDIDGMFDDLDSSLNDDDIIPPSPLQTVDTESNQNEKEISPVPQKGHLPLKLPGHGGDVLHSARRSLSSELDMVEDLNIPFKVHGPVKTSSPIQEKMVVEAVGEEDNERALVVPQTLDFEEPKADLVNIQNLQCNGHITEEVDSELESPPSKVTFSKPTMPSHKKRVVTSCKESRPTQEKTPKKSQRPVLQVERKTPSNRQEITEPPVAAVRQDPERPSPEKNLSFDKPPSAEISTRGEKDIKAFIQKVRDAERTKSACSRGLQSVVKVPASPEPDDDFLILEDDTPLIYIPCKTSTRKRQRQEETMARQSSTDKDSSADKVTTGSQMETAKNYEELEKENPKQGSQPIDQKMKKNKVKDKRIEVTGPGDDENEFAIPEDVSPGDLVEQEKPNKKKHRDKKVPKEPKDRASRETDKETRPQKLKKKTQKSSEVKSSNNGKENAVKKHTETDLGSLSDGKAKQNRLPVVSAGSSSEEGEVLGKRKRKHPGQWWLSSLQSTEEAKDNQPTLKKSKQKKQESRAGVPSPVKAKKDRVVTRRNQKRPAPPSSEHTNKAEENKIKRNKRRNKRGETPDTRKTTDEVFNAVEVEQIEDQDVQQDVPDQDLDHEHLSPLVFAQRDVNLSSGNKLFERVYHHVSNENTSGTPTSVSPTRLQQLREREPGRRRRKPPGSWWLLNGVSEDAECSSSQPQTFHCKEPKPRKERKNPPQQNRSPRLGTPKNGNMAVSSKPLGGTCTPSRKLKPLFAPKTVKRSLATFKDIFTSATETETEMSNGDTCQNNRHNVHAHSAEEISVFLQNHDTPPDSKCQSENTLKELKSGPSSMIQLEQYEENEDLILPSSRVHAVLSMSDLCAPPLKPLILQPKDEANLMEWFKSLWPTLAPNAAEITPNQFDWYFYQDRAIGFHLDVNCGSACIGRILLGSYMKKPLWVDHSALTVFNLLTSSVNVVIDSRESRFHAGQCFTVQCGHAYSIQNVTAQPAVLYFTRILAEGSD